MRMKNSDLILYAIHEITKDHNLEKNVSREDISATLNIKDSSLNVYLSGLSREGRIIREKRHFNRDLSSVVRITDEGMEVVDGITEELKQCYFTPERHNIPACVGFMELYERYTNPLERIFLLNLYVRKYSFDLNEYLENLSTAKNEFSIAGYFRSMENRSHPEKPYYMDVFKLTLYGCSPGETGSIDEVPLGDVNSMIIHSETLIRQGKLEQAEGILKLLLKERMEIDQNQWFQVIINLSTLHMKKGENERALELIEKTKSETRDSLLIACLENMMGKLMIRMGEYKKALNHISYGLRSFQMFNNPLLTMIALNNRGVLYFIDNDFSNAEKDWKNARRRAREAGSSHAEALILTNIADIHIKKGELDLAEKYLSTAMKILKGINQLEGLSSVYFNKALLEIARYDPKRAREYHGLSNSIAYPLPSPWEKEVRKKEILSRCKEHGMKPIFDPEESKTEEK